MSWGNIFEILMAIRGKDGHVLLNHILEKTLMGLWFCSSNRFYSNMEQAEA